MERNSITLRVRVTARVRVMVMARGALVSGVFALAHG